MQHRAIISELSSLDLSQVPHDQVKSKIQQLGKFGAVVTTLHPGKKIIRARLNDGVPFTEISQLSYKPQTFNKTYLRASTPNKTMFYGSIVPEVISETEPDTARATIVFELSAFVRDKESVGEEDITFSAWEVCENIELVSLIHHKGFKRPTALSEKLQKEYEQFISNHPEMELPSKEISEYLASEFAKFPIGQHTDYLISAVYAEMTALQFDGVLYPSVQLAGEGVNVAIKPESVESKLKFLGASECTIYKNKEQVVVGNNTQANAVDDNQLVYSILPDNIHVSRKTGRKMVGLD